MFLATFERLASEYQSLASVFKLIDATVADTAKALLDAYMLASELGEQQARVDSALQAAVKAGVLMRHEGRVCGTCGQWQPNDQAQAECTQCEAVVRSKRVEIRYRLSDAGRKEQSAATAGVGTTTWLSAISAYRGKIRFAIVTIKPEEEDAVLEKFPSQHTLKGQRSYHLTRIKTPSGETIIVASARLPRQGNLEAQAVVGQLIDDLAPSCVLLVGIGGASPFGDAVLGDVVFGTHVHDLTVALDNADGIKEFAGEGGPMVERVVAAVTHLRPALQSTTRVEAAPAMDLDGLEFTTGDEQLNKKIRDRLIDRFAPGADGGSRGGTKVFVGPIISSDALMKNPVVAKQWCETRRDALAIDMEFAGAYRASRSAGRVAGLLAVRAISDIVGHKKSEGWVRHACVVAAEYAYAFVVQWTP
jgi:nucleoside phosphorylase